MPKETDKNSWWIYEGSKELSDISTIIPPWRDKKVENKGHNAKNFIPLSDELINAVNTAIYLRRPLLVTGKPGIGKSSLAKSIAHQLLGEGSEPLYWQITSKSELKDALYSYDALSRLQDIQIKHLDKNSEELETGIENYLKLTSLGTAFVSDKQPMVVLIDEIDKSDVDLPNDLLHIFEEQEFEIDELKRMKFKEGAEPSIEDALGKGHKLKDGKVVCKHFPIIVMTSNDEREFPPAFLRRCISVEMKLDENEKKREEQLTQIVKAHFGADKIDEQVTKLIKDFMDAKGLQSNDQLLNAIFLLMNTKHDSFEAFKAECERILFKSLNA